MQIPDGFELYTIQATGKQYVARSDGCMFCKHLSDVYWDFTNGIYMIICEHYRDIEKGLAGKCKLFKRGENDD